MKKSPPWIWISRRVTESGCLRANGIRSASVPRWIALKQVSRRSNAAWNYATALISVVAPYPVATFYSRRSAIFSLMLAIALAGFKPFGQVVVQFMMVWQR